MRTRLVLAGVCLGALLVAACSSGEATRERLSSSGSVRLPSTLLGLRVEVEDVSSQLEDVEGSYFDAVGLYSFRRDDDLLRATLQVGRFGVIADPGDPGFRADVIGNLGSALAEEIRVGDQIIFLTTGNEQNIFAWFEDDAFLVLSIRNDYGFPRTLLRKLVEGDLIR